MPRQPASGQRTVPGAAYPNRLKRKRKTPSELLPRVHRVISLLKRWPLSTHQGAVNQKLLDYYLDEFTFRFNRRPSKSQGKLFFRLAQQAVAIYPIPYRESSTQLVVKPNHNLGLPEPGFVKISES